MSRPWFVLVGAVVALADGSAEAAASSTPVPHRVFGLLQSARGSALTLRLRDGRLLAIDAAPAFAQKRVSAPLFAGKSTVVDGFFGPRGIFYATAVKRAAPQPTSWGPDR
jgi:hypothetical protein